MAIEPRYMPSDTEPKYATDFGSFRPGPFTLRILTALERNKPKRPTRLSIAIDRTIRQEMQFRARKHWEAGGDVAALETP